MCTLSQRNMYTWGHSFVRVTIGILLCQHSQPSNRKNLHLIWGRGRRGWLLSEIEGRQKRRKMRRRRRKVKKRKIIPTINISLNTTKKTISTPFRSELKITVVSVFPLWLKFYFKGSHTVLNSFLH